MSEVCSIKLVCDPIELIVFITGPVPGDLNDNDCVVTEWPNENVGTSNGEARVDLACGERFCLKFFLDDESYADYPGEVALYCDGKDATFYRIPVNFTPAGRANGQECFKVDCEEE